MDKVPISVLIVTKNEGRNIAQCLNALQNFDEIIVIDSHSADGTVSAAESFGVRIEQFKWNARYPKKRQWCLDNLDLKHDRVLFIDADEEMTLALEAEIRALDWQADGYFIKGQYVMGGVSLRFGMQNNKLCLFDRRKVAFPVVDDLDIEGMGEIEGHYQPVGKTDDIRLGQLKNALLHHAFAGHEERHDRYAQWEAEMIRRNAYPKDPVLWRENLKTVFRSMPLRAEVAFTQSYVFKLGFLDGVRGYRFAKSRYDYYRAVRDFKNQYKRGDLDLKARDAA
ncbi:MAG: glycosyltransferase family 2 protein [Pseudomonadota bacterium]